MDQSSLTVTLQELIDSGCTSECSFSISGNVNDNLTCSIDSTSNDERSRKRSLHIANAVKISLLLSKAYARCRDANCKNLLSVQPEHVHVKLSSLPAPAGNRSDLLGHHYCDGGKEHKVDNISGFNVDNFLGSSRDFSVLDLSIVMPMPNQELPNENGNISLLRHLGHLIYSVFSLNKESPWPETKQQSEVIIDGCNRRIRRGNNIEESLFSNLLGTGDYPVSICRLISDLIDTGGNDRGDDSAFRSMNEVIEDLEQMLLIPNIFLHDAMDVDFKLSFGQRCYGQKKEISQLLMISTGMEQPTAQASAEVVYVSGVAGIGKTHLVERVADFLSSLGYWIVVKTKFERGLQHESRQRISSLFDNLVSAIVNMRDRGGNESDMDYGRRATEAISIAIDEAGLSTLSAEDFIPSLGMLIPRTARSNSPPIVEMKAWQLTFLLTKLMGALLSLDRFIMIHLDDLQWCDPVMLAMISEIIIQSGQQKRRCIFVGTIRSNCMSGINPLMTHYNGLKSNKHVNVTDIQLSSLTQDDLVEMTTTEMRLPKRFVVDLAAAVHRKTAGHSLFVVQLLNSLLRDGTLAYSPRKRRYDYDRNKLASLKTLESLAKLIVSNLSSLSNTDLQNLRIISCFGMQVDESMLHHIENCPGVQTVDMQASLTRLVNEGILERSSGNIVKFSHDIIHQAVCENMTMEQRGHLEFQLGLFLRSKASPDPGKAPIEARIEKIDLSESQNPGENALASSPSSLIALDMINNAGPKYIGVKFARWNLQAAKGSQVKSNFRASLHYCKKGISFLGNDLWSSETSQLSCELHEAAAFASHAIGNASDGKRFAEAIIKNMPFEQSLSVRLITLRSLDSSGKHQETISQGLSLLRALNFNIPPNPTPTIIMETLLRTGQKLSEYSIEKIIDMQKSTVVDTKMRSILNLVEAVSMSCYQTASPFYPLVTCEILNYSLENGICTESATAFALFGNFEIFLQGKYDSGKLCGSFAENILAHSTRPNIRAGLTLYGFVYLWFKPLKELADELFRLNKIAMKVGDIDGAMYAICQYWRFSFFGGQKLSSLCISYDRFMKLMVKHCHDIVKFCVLDISLTYQLMGKTEDPYSHFEGAIKNESELVMDAKTKKNTQQLQSIALKRCLSAYHYGNYSDAAKFSKEAFSFPTSKTPKIQLVFHYFYHGLISFWLYRDGQGESYLEEGKNAIVKMEEWNANSSCTFENKLLLLEAEDASSQCKRSESIQKYKDAVKAARDNGFIHEQGLGYELMGNYLSSINQSSEANECYKQAYTCYFQWGALAKAKKILEDHHLSMNDIEQNALKHERDW